jgi:hypothetical protein
MERSGIQIPRILLRFIRATTACDAELIGSEGQARHIPAKPANHAIIITFANQATYSE